MDLTGRPAQLILIASVARRYYLEGKSKIEIAEELGLSRFKVGPPARDRPSSSTGIGYALAQQCLRHGFNVLMQVPVTAGRWTRSLALGKKCFYLNLVRR